jgi:hypothetical protein
MDIRCPTCNRVNRVPSLGSGKKAVCGNCRKPLPNPASEKERHDRLWAEAAQLLADQEEVGERAERVERSTKSANPKREAPVPARRREAPAAPRTSERRKPKPVQHLKTFQTSKGAVIVAWLDHREGYARQAKAAVILGGIVQKVFNKQIIPDDVLEDARTDSEGSAPGQIADILKVKPSANLKEYERHLDIEITLQEGPLGKATDSPIFNADAKLSGMRAIADIDRFYEKHKDQFCGPGSSQRVREAYQNMINAHKARILEEMK